MNRLMILLAGLLLALPVTAQQTLKEGMDALQKRYAIHFVYDATLPLGQPVQGKALDARQLNTNLKRLFKNSGIGFEIRKKQVILFREKERKAVSSRRLRSLSEVQLLDSAKVTDWRHGPVQQPAQDILALSPRMLEETPLILGEKDVLKALQLLPGAQAANEGFSGISVRGGYADENLFLLDQVPLYQPEHLFGIFSAFPPEAVGGVKLYKGSFPARYGGRASSIVDVWTEPGNPDRLRGSFTVGLLADNLHLDGPLGERTRFSVSGRLLHTLLAEPVLQLMPWSGNYWFYDLHARLDHRLGDKDRLSLTLYNGTDHFRYKYNQYTYRHEYDENFAAYDIWTAHPEQEYLSWGTTQASLHWAHGDNGETSVSWNGNFLRSRMEKGEVPEGDAEPAGVFSDVETGTSLGGLQFRTQWKAGAFLLGAQYQFLRFGRDGQKGHRWRTLDGVRQWDTLVVRTIGEQYPAHEAALFAEGDFSLGEQVRIAPGLRLSLFHAMGKTWLNPEPRLQVRWTLPGSWRLEAGYARMVQYHHRIPAGFTTLPTDSWQPVSPDVPPLIADQFSVGGQYHGLHGWEFSAELYYKALQGTVEYRHSYAPLGVEYSLWAHSVASGVGRAYGMELLARKTAGRLTGWLGYTLSKTERRFPDGDINEGAWFPATTDRRHRINLGATYAFNNRIELNLAWTFASGNPVTIPTRWAPLLESRYQKTGFAIAPSRNNHRLGPIHRADISVHFRKPLRRGERVWTIGLYNLYGAKNPELISYRSSHQIKGNDIGYFPDIPENTLFALKTSFLLFVPTVSFTRYF